ncbi:phage holin family protein [Frankia nepalensis]|uniref:phage holin family protein n=1 Tax=Frankia nepalensis TaxID=1836974 RepID=UPI0027DD7E26|nr:phage holin family protein [Frankia nepalensis]
MVSFGIGSGAPSGDATTGELVTRLSEQVSRLVRDELALARAEMSRKAKKAALGGGLVGGAGLVGGLGVGVLVACAVLGLATVVAAWLAALIVGLVLVAVAGVLAMVGKKEVREVAPPLPVGAIEGVKDDLHTIREARHR